MQVTAEAARAERRTQRRAKKQAQSENDLPASNVASILSQACVTPQPWTPLSSGAALHASPASSSVSSVVSLSSYASMMSGASADSNTSFCRRPPAAPPPTYAAVTAGSIVHLSRRLTAASERDRASAAMAGRFTCGWSAAESAT